MKKTKIYEIIPEILNADLEPKDLHNKVLENIKEIFGYDEAYVVYLNADSYKIVASTQDKNPEPKATNDFQMRQFIKNKKALIENHTTASNSILSELELAPDSEYCFMALPLILKSALFGAVFLIKKEKDFYKKTDLAPAKALVSICSYSIKDSELSNVFKMQLKSLKENIVEKTKSYEIIKTQNEKIKEADRLKSEFLANMSHELRTPLNAIIGFSEALNLKVFGELNEKQDEYIKDIHSSGVHLLGMINDLLDISKIEANAMKLAREEFDALSASKEVINVVRALAKKKNIKLSLESNEKVLTIYADQQKYHQIMYNLLSNAIKFTENDGEIIVKAKKRDGKVKISVSDTGIGIDEKYHGKIFAKFQQVDSSYTRKHSSTGLGLTITKELVELHGGKIWLESKVNEGTTFTFEIPSRKLEAIK